MAVERGHRDAQKRILFGTCQEQNIFPFHRSPDRLGIQLRAITGDPSLGLGCYPAEERSSPSYSLESKPLSKKGYVIGARTAQRFIPEPQLPCFSLQHSMMTRVLQHAFLPWIEGDSTGKFQYYKHHTPPPEMRYFVPIFSKPGTSEADKQLYKKITWPMKFGSPDWSLVPTPAKRMLKMEVQKLTVDREFWKHRGRVAYLSLYPSLYLSLSDSGGVRAVPPLPAPWGSSGLGSPAPPSPSQ